MGKGDKRSGKGKLWKGTKGKTRPARPQNKKARAALKQATEQNVAVS
jgi:ribosomal small subunit protein bTHX